MLGTRNATVSGIYNTCFLLDTPNIKLMVDAGGGNGVLGQLKKVGVGIADYLRRRKPSPLARLLTPRRLPKTSKAESWYQMI